MVKAQGSPPFSSFCCCSLEKVRVVEHMVKVALVWQPPASSFPSPSSS